eukprot:2264063-Prorocentrum_lima.AAC.1
MASRSRCRIGQKVARATLTWTVAAGPDVYASYVKTLAWNGSLRALCLACAWEVVAGRIDQVLL